MLVTTQSTEVYAKKEAGGKGFNLYLMSQNHLPVPEWVIFGTRYLERFLQETQIYTSLQQKIKQFENNEITALELEKEVLHLFSSAPSPHFLKEALQTALEKLKPFKTFSVRSSAADEDSLSHSFAGQLSSFLYVEAQDDISQYLKLCWASAYSERSLIYRKENKLSLNNISVAVILQRMIDPQTSGVLFTCNPIEKNLSHYIVSSVYGVGEGLVSGALEADTFWLDSTSGHITQTHLACKKESIRKSSSGTTLTIPVPETQQNTASLTPVQLKELFVLGQKIHQFYHRPQDIEWAFHNQKLYLLQTRPVTHLQKNLMGYPNLWDNSNIIESYGGLTSPLSFSFALRNYKAVYVQFCEVLGLPARVIREMDSYLSYMLGCMNGRVYYNLFNWYKLVNVLPGFKQNKEFMETMMGVQVALNEEISDRLRPHPSWNTLKGKGRKIVSGLNFIRYHFTIQSLVDDFLKTFHEDYSHYKNLPLKRMRGDQLVQVYMEMESKMFGRWQAPIINDFLCMVHFGLLRKLTSLWLKDLDSTLQNDLLAGEGGLESAEPTRLAMKLALVAQAHPELKELILKTDSKDVLEALNQSPHQDFYAQVNDYLDRFGFRCMSEMKLEEMDLHSDPSYLFVVLKNYLNLPKLEMPDHGKEQNLRHAAEKKVFAHLSGWRKYFYSWVLKHARKAVKNRENTRFARTRIYGIARTIFQTIGADLSAMNVLNKDRDIFWLTIEEIFGIYNGTLSSYALKEFVEIRKKSYHQYQEETDPRFLTRGPVYWNNSFQNPLPENKVEGDFDLTGLPCCPGIIEGTVKVILNPTDNLELKGEILVTTRTDPGWVPLYPSISGLLVERGSLLSHSAIVAREMSIPAIVSIPHLTQTLKSGMKIRIDGKAGTIKILSDASLPHD